MRSRNISISIFGYFLLVQVLFAGDLDRRVAVLPFEAKLIETDYALILSESVRTEMGRLEEFDVIDRKNMDLILKEQQIQLHDCTESECAVRFGEILNVRWIIVGSLSKFGSKYLFMTSRVDVQTGQIVAVSQKESVNLEDLHDDVPVVVLELLGLVDNTRTIMTDQDVGTGGVSKPETGRSSEAGKPGAGKATRLSVPPPIVRGGGEPPVIEWIQQPPGTMSLTDGRRIIFKFRGHDDRCIDGYQYKLNDQKAESTKRDQVELKDLPEGDHIFEVMAGDCDGNWSSPIYSEFTIRNSPPEVSISKPAEGSLVIDKTLNVTLTGSDVDGTVSEFRCAVNNPDNPLTQASPKFEFDVADGPVTIFAQSVDDRGLESSWVDHSITFQYANDPTPSPTPVTHSISGARAGEIKSVDLGGGISLELVYIPGGHFMMGSPSEDGGHPEDESPIHDVEITGFWMGRYEVTQAQFYALMKKKPSYFVGEKLPVEQVKWSDACLFCQKLSQLAGLNFRLPTEAEWEYACRAGSTTRFSFGDDESVADRYAWTRNNSKRTPHSVGRLLPNEWGLYDMHGNVKEWCMDYYDKAYYRSCPAEDPKGPESGFYLNRRGGSFIDPPSRCRSAFRSGYQATGASSDLGFRVVLTNE